MVVVIGAGLAGPCVDLRRRAVDGVAGAPAAGVAVGNGRKLSGGVAVIRDGEVSGEVAVRCDGEMSGGVAVRCDGGVSGGSEVAAAG